MPNKLGKMWHKNKKRSLARWLNSVSAVRTRLELATPGVTNYRTNCQ